MSNGENNIFVSYRREDSTGETFQLVKSLKQFINGQKIFLDNEKLEPGQDFPKALKQHLKNCDIILVVIGKKWLEYNGDNSLPLSDEGNWVRIEIATAIRQGKLIIPILLNGTTMPRKEDLPSVLAPLVNKQAKEIYYRTWDNDAKELAEFLRQKGVLFVEDEKLRKRIEIVFSKWTLLILVVIAVGLYLLLQSLMGEPEKEDPKPSEIYAINTNKPKPGLIPIGKRNIFFDRYGITGIWMPEKGTGFFYYKIISTTNGLSVQVWNNGIIETTGTIFQMDSLVTISYRDKQTGNVQMKGVISDNGRRMKGSRLYGDTRIGIGFTLVKGENKH